MSQNHDNMDVDFINRWSFRKEARMRDKAKRRQIRMLMQEPMYRATRFFELGRGWK